MIGMDRNTGKRLDDLAHLKQSLRDRLMTPVGSRVMRRDYGSDLFERIDDPADQRFLVEVTSNVAQALMPERRFRLRQVRLHEITSEGPTFDLEGDYLPEGRRVTLEGV